MGQYGDTVNRVKITGSVGSEVTELSRRALVTYIHTWQDFSQLHPGVDFLLLTFESWRRSMGHYPGRKFDLVAVATPMVIEKLMDHPRIFPVCTPVDIDWSDREFKEHVQPQSQCWLVPLSSPPPAVWFGYPFALDLLHFRLPGFQAFLKALDYKLVLKTATGSVTSPALSGWIPERFTVGAAEYVHVPETGRRIEYLAGHLNLKHPGDHGVGSTWYGSTGDVLQLAGLTLDLLRFILEETFPEVMVEGLSVEEFLQDADWHALQDRRTKDGMLPWNPAMAALYAGDLAINHYVADWGWDPKLDASATRRTGMDQVALVKPALHDPTLDIDRMLKSTQAFCDAWKAGKRGDEGTVGHYASLIACQASETATPKFEQRYAQNFH